MAAQNQIGSTQKLLGGVPQHQRWLAVWDDAYQRIWFDTPWTRLHLGAISARLSCEGICVHSSQSVAPHVLSVALPSSLLLGQRPLAPLAAVEADVCRAPYPPLPQLGKVVRAGLLVTKK